MIEDALRTKLLANTGITNLVGNRIYVQQAQQAAPTPYIVYTVVSLTPEYCQNDESDDILIQYSCFSERYSEARTLANLIRQELNGFSGTLEGLNIPMIIFDSQGANEREKDSQLSHISYDFRIRKD